MKILQSEKDKLINWINQSELHNYLVNVCGYSQTDAQYIIYNIETIAVYDEDNEYEYVTHKDGEYWYIGQYANNEMTFGVMGKSLPECYCQMFKNS